MNAGHAHHAGLRSACRGREAAPEGGPIVYCAVIKGAYTVPNGPDCWTIETLWSEQTRITVPVRNVIACGGETCSCCPQEATSERAERAAEAQKGLTC